MHLRQAHLADPVLFEFMRVTLGGATLGGANGEKF
jgi:hypothetical protein